MTASITGSLEGLTPLIIALLAFAALIIFRNEIKATFRRLTKVEAKRKGVHVTADLGDDPEAEVDAGSSATGREEPKSSHESDEIAAISAGDAGNAGDAETVRAQMMRAYLEGDKKAGDELFEKLGPLEDDPQERRRDRARQLATQVTGGIEGDGSPRGALRGRRRRRRARRSGTPRSPRRRDSLRRGGRTGRRPGVRARPPSVAPRRAGAEAQGERRREDLDERIAQSEELSPRRSGSTVHDRVLALGEGALPAGS
jgi:hypothetical protein